MMRFYKLYAILLVLGMVFQTTAAAQKLPSETKNGDGLKPELKEDALKLLSAVAGEAQQFGLPENRIRAQIVIAHLMWKDDEQAARAVFGNAFGELQNMFLSAGLPEGVELNSMEKSRQYSIRYRLVDLRKDLVLTLAVRDSESALGALAALKLPPIDDNDPLASDDLELKVTAAIAKKEPDKSYTVARQKLDTSGVTYEFIDALKDLHKRDAPLAANLARDVLAKIKTLKIRVPTTESSRAMQIDGKKEVDFWQVTGFVVAAAAVSRQASGSRKKTVPLLSEAEMKELIEIAAGAFLAERDPAMYAISPVMGDIARYSPPLAQRIRQKLGAEASQYLDKTTESNSFFTASREKNADELAKIADVSAPEVRDSRYSAAAFKALEENEPEKALLIAERIKERKNYAYLFEQIQVATPIAKARRGDIDEVRRMLSTFKTNEERVATLTELAGAFAVKGEKETAKALLEEAQQLMPALMRKQTDLEAFAKIAFVYSVADPERAFEIIESGIGQMNEVVSAGIRVDEFYANGALDQNELLLLSVNRQVLLHVPNAAALLKNLALADFQRAVNLADKFERPEIRLFIRLRIAQSVLDLKSAEREISDRNQLTGGGDEMY